MLLKACSNLANLTLARATARDHSIAVWLAIGASHGRLVRLLMAESVLLAVAGGGCGMVLAGELSRLLVAFLGAPGMPLFLDLRPNAGVLAFDTGIAALTCILFGLIPAMRANRRAPADVMKNGRPQHDGQPRTIRIAADAGGVAGGSCLGSAATDAASSSKGAVNFQTSSMRRSRAIACAARDRVRSVTEALPGL